MQILLAVLACYLTLSAVVNLYRHISVKNKPVEDLEIEFKQLDSETGRVKITNNTQHDVYNIAVISSSDDFNIADFMISELKRKESYSQKVIMEPSLEFEEINDNDFEFADLILVIIAVCLVYLLYYSIRHKHKLRAVLVTVYLLTILCLSYLDYMSLHLDKSYLHEQTASLSGVAVYCTYTLTDNTYIDANNNQKPDCIEYADWYKDTDGDGLSDYIELTCTNTNSLSPVSFNTTDLLYDSDADELSNELELSLHSNPLSSDTDMDGLDDYTEYVIGTNLSESDTDKDGLSDYNEMQYQTDPLTYNAEFRLNLSQSDNENSLQFTISAVGNGDSIERFRIKRVTDNFLLSDKMAGYIGSAFDCYWEPEVGLAVDRVYDDRAYAERAYEISSKSLDKSLYRNMYDRFVLRADKDWFMDNSDMHLEVPDKWSWLPWAESDIRLGSQSALDEYFKVTDYLFSEPVTITFEFDNRLLKHEGFEPCIYYYDDKTQQLSELETSVSGNRASAVVNHFSTYLLLDKSKLDISSLGACVRDSTVGLDKQVVVLLDNSSSMSVNEEVNFRVNILDRYFGGLNERETVSVYKFTKMLDKLSEFTSDYNSLLQIISSLELDDGKQKDSGTYYLSALYHALDVFNVADSLDKRILLFTDGRETKYDYKETITLKDIISKADKLGVSIDIIGLGKSIKEADLKQLAYDTGGLYIRLRELLSETEIEDVSEHLVNTIIDRDYDSNQDGLSDYYTDLILSKQLLTGTGISFDLLDIDLEDKDWDKDGVLNGEELKVITDNDRAYLYAYSNPLLQDSDFDGIDDKKDTAPLSKGLMGGIVGNLIVVSSVKSNTTGHSYLAYESLVNDTLDISDYLYAKHSNTVSRKKEYGLSSGDILTLGNFAHIEPNAIVVAYNILTDVYVFGGITCNCELYYPDKYMCSDDTSSYEMYITGESLDKLFKYLDSHNYYNVYTNNCATIAAGGWRASLDNTSSRQIVFNASVTAHPSLFRLFNPISLRHILGYKDSGVIKHIDLPIVLRKSIGDRQEGLASLSDYAKKWNTD